MIADLNPSAVHHHARHLRNLVGRALAALGKWQRLIGLRLLARLFHTLGADPLRPPLDPLGGHGRFGQRLKVFARRGERPGPRRRMDHLLEHPDRERTIDLHADRAGQREKKPCGSKDKSTPVR